MIYRVIWWYWRRFRHEIHVNEILYIISSKLGINPWITRRHKLLLRYAKGESIESIAYSEGLTRERIRQIIWKAWRENKKS